MIGSTFTTTFNGVKIPAFKLGQSKGAMSASYDEISDLVHPANPANAGYIWGLDDGLVNRIIAFNPNTAAVAGEWTLTGFSGIDVECLASFRKNDKFYVVLGDTGNNANSANSRGTGIDLRLVRIEEPTITGSNGSISSSQYSVISCAFPLSATPSLRDVECMLADQHTGDLFIITKRIHPIKVYKLPYNETYSTIQELTFVGDMTTNAVLSVISTTPSGNNGYTVGGSVSPNNKEIVIKSYSNMYLWRLSATESIEQALMREFNYNLETEYVGGGRRFTSPNSEPQGESVCYDASGSSLFHVSELVTAAATENPPLFQMNRLTTFPSICSFQQGISSYFSSYDTYLDSGAPTTSQAASVSLVCDFDYSAFPTISRTRQGLIFHSVSAIPSNAIVTSAYYRFYINTEGLGLSLHKMLIPWAATDTWNSMTGGISTDNIDAEQHALGIIGDTAAGTELDTYVGFIRVNVALSAVQEWVSNPSSNYGIVVNAITESTGDGIQIDSAESVTAVRRPQLNVAFYVPTN